MILMFLNTDNHNYTHFVKIISRIIKKGYYPSTYKTK